MKILVPIKRVPDPATTIRVLPDGTGIATDNVKWVINPFCEIAIEEALRIKEKQTGEVMLVTVGQSTWQEQLRTGLAMGADRAILVKTDTAPDSLAIARILAKIAGDEKPDLIILGKQAIDDDSNQVGQMLAEMLGWPQATFASKIEIAPRRPRSCAKLTAASRRSRSSCPPLSPPTCASTSRVTRRCRES